MASRRTTLGTLLVIGGALAPVALPLLHAQSGRLPTRAARDLPEVALWSKADAVRLGAVVAGVAIILPLDEVLAQRIRAPWLRDDRGLLRASSIVGPLGDPGAIILTTGLYAAGRLTGRHAVADAGLHATEAIIASGAMSGVVKFAVGRARPTLASADDPGEFGDETPEFRPLRGLGGYTSFPSGHTTVAFAAASAVSAELRLEHPDVARFATPLLYGGATLVGLSRMYDNKHWASDVAMGAAIGTFVGRRMVAYQHAHPNNRLDRWLLPASVGARDGSVSLGWHATFR